MIISIKKAVDIFLKFCKTRSEKEGIPEENAFNKIKKYVDQSGIFFHMSNSDSVYGVNIKTNYNTPAGIYLYPLDSSHYEELINGQLPFLASAPYIWIFKVDGNIIKSSTYSEQDLSSDIEKLKEIEGEKVTDVTDKAHIKAIKNHALSQLFYIIYNLCGGFGSANIFKVTNLFKKLNYDGIFDDQGLGIIHTAEPIQAVIFSTKNCKPIDIINNERIKDKGFPINFLYNLEEKLENITEEEFLQLPTKSQILAFKLKPDCLIWIKNQSEAVKLAAVNQNGLAIRYIENPSEAVQIAAVKQNGLALRYIENPSENVQLAAVKQNPDALLYITNPSEAVFVAAGK